MKWMIPEDRLSPEQKESITKIGLANEKPSWVQGHAGSGKSIVLLYALTDYLIKNKNANVAVVVFTHALKDMLRNGIKQIPVLNSTNIPVFTIYKMKSEIVHNSYDAIFCDEVQDLPLQFIQELKNGCKHLVIAGDAVQSIYEFDPMLNLPTASLKEINDVIQPESHILSEVFRLTQNVLSILRNVFTSFFAATVHIGNVNTDIRLRRAKNKSEELEWVWNEMKNISMNRPEEVCAILVFKKDHIIDIINTILQMENKPTWPITMKMHFGKNIIDFENLNKHLSKNNVPLMFIGNNIGKLSEADKANKIVIMTYHSSKGLDFDTVALPSIETDIAFTSNKDALALVALSRSKRDLFITFTGNMDPVFDQFLNGLTIKDINDNEEAEIIF